MVILYGEAEETRPSAVFEVLFDDVLGALMMLSRRSKISRRLPLRRGRWWRENLVSPGGANEGGRPGS